MLSAGCRPRRRNDKQQQHVRFCITASSLQDAAACKVLQTARDPSGPCTSPKTPHPQNDQEAIHAATPQHRQMLRRHHRCATEIAEVPLDRSSPIDALPGSGDHRMPPPPTFCRLAALKGVGPFCRTLLSGHLHMIPAAVFSSESALPFRAEPFRHYYSYADMMPASSRLGARVCNRRRKPTQQPATRCPTGRTLCSKHLRRALLLSNGIVCACR